MSDNVINKLPLNSEAKAKIKKIAPIVAIVIVLLIVVKLISSAGNSGKSVNKDSIKLLQKQNPKKILSVMPDGFEEDVIDYYDYYVKDKKQLKDAIENEKTFSKFQEIGLKNIKKVKITENIDIDTSNISDAPLSQMESAIVKEKLNAIKAVYKDNYTEGDAVVSIAEITYKDDNGDKKTDDYLLLSIKIGKKWYSANCMESVIHSAWGYDAKMADRKK